jgi:hypothetical protein
MKVENRIKLCRAVGLIKAAPKKVSFSQANPLPRNILLLFPLSEEHVHQCRYVVDHLQGCLASGRVFFAIAETYRDIFNCSPRYAFHFPVIKNDPYRMRLDVLLARYKGQQFDAVLNLDPGFNLQMARVISAIKTSRRIGFAGPFADLLYNIQIQAADHSNLEKSYDQMLALCDLDWQDQPADEQLSLV